MPATDAESMTLAQPRQRLTRDAFSRLFPKQFSPAAADAPLAGAMADVSRLTGNVAERFLFSGMWVLIASVSSVDTYLTVRFREHLYYEELNPIARFLLSLDGWEPSILIGAKFLGSILVLGFIAALYSQNRRIGLIVTGALASFQLALLIFLTIV